ncbi:MAG: histidine triad nucleotide-binding protein [Anaerolineales bacterium]|nr:histidine triad nucleotide-binding protein [Anaerolineales bacterium]MDP3186290.1 histidine triad nucleotide-binding protein [Anaerolineales bacterium]
MSSSLVVTLLGRIAKMSPCLFCKIIRGEAPGKILYRDEQVTAFRDIHPVAPVHILIIPNRHILSVNDLTPEDEPLIGHLFTVARQLVKQEGIDESGYRLIFNTGAHGGQTVFHLHMHLIGGQRMRHPIG